MHVILFSHPEQDGGGALVVQWKHGGAGKRIYASNFYKKTPGQEDLTKVACFCANAEFKPEDLVKPRFLELGHIGIFLSLSSRSCLGP